MDIPKKTESYEALDDLDLNELLAKGGYQHVFDALAKAAKGKFTRMARANAAVEVNLTITDAEAEAAYLWGDAKFRDLVMAIPKRLPLAEFKIRFLEARLWSRHLRFLGGIARYIERQNSKLPEDEHWHRFRLGVNRLTKAKSPSRKAWLEATKDKQAEASQRANVKRKAARAEAKAVRKIKKALGVK